jgi:putative ABC transport system permease protein
VTLLSHWRRHPGILATSFVGLAVATALWSGVQAINQEARQSYDAAAVTIGSDLRTIEAADGAAFPQDLYVALRRAGWRVSPVLEGEVRVEGQTLRLMGVDPVTLPRGSVLSGGVGGGNMQAFLVPPFLTLAAEATIEALGAATGDTLAIPPRGTLPPLAAGAGLAPGLVAVDIGVAQTLLGEVGLVSRLIVDPDQREGLPEVAAVTAGRLQLRDAAGAGDLGELTDSFHLNLTAFGFLAFVVGLFIVHAAIGLAFEQRRPMLRTLRASGVSARSLAAVLAGETLLIALVAGLAGLAGGYLVAAALLPDVAASLRSLYGAEVSGTLGLRPSWWLAGLAMAAAGALAASGASLLRAYRLPLLASALPGAWVEAQQRWLFGQGVVALLVLLAGAGVLAFGGGLLAGFAALAALLLGTTLLLPLVLGAILALAARLARGPIARWFWADTRQQLSGLSLALMALLLALSANIGVGGMVDGFRLTFTGWLDQRLDADVFLEAADAESGRRIAALLAERPEVAAVVPSGRTEIRLDGRPVDVVGFRDDPRLRRSFPLLEAEPDAWGAVQEGSAVLVSEQLARRLSLGLGDSLDLPLGGGWSVGVAGVYADYGNPDGEIRAGLDALAARAGVAPTGFNLWVEPGAAPALLGALRSGFGEDLLRATDQAGMKGVALSVFERTFTVTAALNVLTLGVAGIALLTSLLTLSALRLPQLAPLWAVGLTRRQLAALELLKVLLLALVTAVFAIPLGVLVTWCLVAVVNVEAFGWRLPLHLFPLQWLRLGGLALLAGLLAAAPSVIQLARLPPARLLGVFANER